VKELRFVFGQFLVEVFDAGVFGQDGDRPGGTTWEPVNRVKERSGAVGGEGAIEGVGGAGLDGDFPLRW